LKTHTVSSFIDFVTHIDKSSPKDAQVIFRGQGIRGNLLPGVARKNCKLNTKPTEQTVLRQLRLLGASQLMHASPSDLDLLVIAQHYGLLTRLLDWSGNALAALWFACSSRENGDVYVYSLVADSLMDTDVYEGDPFKRKRTRVIQPRLNNDRIVVQQGWFTLHRYSEKSKRFVPLEKNRDTKAHLTEYCIPSSLRKDILVSLDRHGVSARTVFPHLDGLCQYLNWKHLDS